MGENTKIEWCDDTVNFWWGCSHHGAGCLNCYAESISNRFGQFWGPHAPRLYISSADKTCRRLDRKAEREGRRRRVFVNSMSDFFESHDGAVVNRFDERMYPFDGGFESFSDSESRNFDLSPASLDDLRHSAMDMFQICSSLDFLLLTKRPENICTMLGGRKFHNVWLGTSISTQADADRNIPLLLECRELAPVLFLSCEPLLGPLDLSPWLDRIDWVIVGGESGHDAWPMHPDWARSIRDQCVAGGVPYFFKQWGEFGTISFNLQTGESLFRQFNTFEQWTSKAQSWINGGICLDSFGEQLKTYQDFRAARDNGHFPVTVIHRIGKKRAGRLLDGREWNEFPEAIHGR